MRRLLNFIYEIAAAEAQRTEPLNTSDNVGQKFFRTFFLWG